MANTPMAVKTRPFAIEPVTRVMLGDGIFDNALYKLRIACHYTNTSSSDLTNVTLYLESIGDPGIAVTAQTYTFARIPAGASVLVSWAADFEHASPGKPLVSFVARADGFTSARSIRQIFVSQTRYDSATKVYTCTIPEGKLEISRVSVIKPAPGSWWPGDQDPGKRGWLGPFVPNGITWTWTPNPAYAGTHGELPFNDPWWKVVALIVLIVAAIVGIIAAALGAGTFNPGIGGKFEETDPDIVTSCCKPKPGGGVEGGTTVAGAAGVVASVALAVALADDADPMWRGQIATPPPAGELTISERVEAKWKFLDEPHAGAPYRTRVEWKYERTTTGGVYHHAVEEIQTNIHVTDDVKVVTPATVQGPHGDLWVKTSFSRPDGTDFAGPQLYTLAIFQAPKGMNFVVPLLDDGLGRDDKPNDGVYTGGLSLDLASRRLKPAGQDVYGTWKVFVFGQDVNLVAPGTPPEIAAQTIGGFFVGSAVQIAFDPNLPCPLKAQGTIEVVGP
jgi:hypothetical protein